MRPEAEEVLMSEEKEVNCKTKRCWRRSSEQQLGNMDPGLMPPLICCVTLDKLVTSLWPQTPHRLNGRQVKCPNPKLPSSPHI